MQGVESRMITKDQIPGMVDYAVRKTLREQHGDKRSDWNAWVNTALLVVTAIMVGYSIFSGG